MSDKNLILNLYLRAQAFEITQTNSLSLTRAALYKMTSLHDYKAQEGILEQYLVGCHYNADVAQKVETVQYMCFKFECL